MLGPRYQAPPWIVRPVRNLETQVVVEMYLSILQITSVVSQ